MDSLRSLLGGRFTEGLIGWKSTAELIGCEKLVGWESLGTHSLHDICWGAHWMGGPLGNC